jgi:hypothetical protein
VPGFSACRSGFLGLAGSMLLAAAAVGAPPGFLGVYGEDAPGTASRALNVAAAQYAAGAP